MGGLLLVVLPVFLVIGFGYGSARMGWISEGAIDGLMTFTQKFAVPCLLFSAIANLDLSQSFDLRLLGSFYTGAITGFTLCFLGARYLFSRPWEDCAAIGFCGLFSNSVLLGLPISERAYGVDSLAPNFAIISVHSPFCFLVGITAMEMVRNHGGTRIQTVRAVFRAMFRNALVVGLTLGFVVNFSGVTLPVPLTAAVEMMVRSALPAALFGLGGVLVRYRPEGDMLTVLMVVVVSLIVHPAIAFGLGSSFGIEREILRNGVITAAMAPGVNAYLFADMYGRARRVAATSVLAATAASVVTIWAWLHILG